MTDIYPGATWIDTGDAGAMSGLRGCTWHEAVTRGTVQDIAGWVRSAKAAHMFNGEQGDCGQYIRVGRKAYGVKDGNHDLLTVESYDGLKIQENPYREIGIGGIYGDSANTGRWDDGQCERAADIMAWLYIDHGVPIQMMPDSKPSSTGHAPHRWGIAPWRVAGGEVWTAHDGKPCPGDLRVLQMPAIVARAKVIAAAIRSGRCTYLPTGPVDLRSALARTNSTPPPQPTPPPPEDDDMPITDADADKIADRVLTKLGITKDFQYNAYNPETDEEKFVPKATLGDAIRAIATMSARTYRRVSGK